MGIKTIATNCTGPARHCLSLTVDDATRIEIDRYDSGNITIWFGQPVAGSISLSRDNLARLSDVISRAIYELDMAERVDALPADTPPTPDEREAIIDG